jgi:DNA-binding beta-propeller fold protein YncE
MSTRHRLSSLALLAISLAAVIGQAPLASAAAGRALQPARSTLAGVEKPRPPRAGLHRHALAEALSSRAFGELAGTGLDRRFLPTATARGVQFGFGRALVGSAPTQPFPGSVAVNTKTDTIYVANGFDPDSPPAGGDTVTVIDGRRCQARDVSRCKGPWPVVKVGNLPSTLAIDQATNTIYVTNYGDGTVSVINGATCDAQVHSGCGQTPPAVTVGTPNSGTLGIYADHANHTVYVGNFNTTAIAVINSATCNATDLGGCASQHPPTVTVGQGPGDVDVNQRTHTGYVALLTGVAAFDTSTCNSAVMSGCGQIGTIPLPNLPACMQNDCGPFSAKADPANNTIYVANGANDTVSVINGRTCDAADLAGCATHQPGTVTIGPVNGVEGVIWVAVDTPAHTVYVVNHKDDDASVINANTCNGTHLPACTTLVPPTIHTGTNPQAVAVNPRTQTLYVGNEFDHDISIIAAALCDASTTSGCRHPAPTAAAGSGPTDIAIDQANRTAYVTDVGPTGTGQTVSMINTQACTARHPAGCAKTSPTVTVGTGPDAAAINNQDHTLYVANSGAGTSGSLSVINTATCNATRQTGCAGAPAMPVPNGHPVAIAINTVTDTIYAGVVPASGPSLIDVYNGATCNAATTSGCGQAPAVITVGKPGYFIPGLAVNQATNTLYATETNGPLQGNQLYVINGAACDAHHSAGCHTTPAHTTVGLTPEGVAVDQATDTIYVADLRNGEGPGAVSVVNGATCNGTHTTGCSTKPAPAAKAGFGTIGVAIDTTADQIYATGIQDTSVSVINGATCNATHLTGCKQTPPKDAVGNFPGFLAVDHSNKTVYIIDNRGADLSLIPTLH